MADAAVKQVRTASSNPKKALLSPHTVLGANVHIEGTFKGEGDLRLEGTFIGNVTTTGHVVIGAEAKLEGDLIGASVTVHGIVTGDIIAKRITIANGGRVLGNLRQEKLLTEDGGFMQGMVTLEKELDIQAVIEALEAPAKEIVEAALEETREETELEKIAAGKR